MNNEFTGKERAAPSGLFGGLAGIAGAFGPVVGGWLTTDASWRWAFRINVILAPLLVVLVLAGVSCDELASSRRPGGGAQRHHRGPFFLVFAIIEDRSYGWWAPVRPLKDRRARHQPARPFRRARRAGHRSDLPQHLRAVERMKISPPPRPALSLLGASLPEASTSKAHHRAPWRAASSPCSSRCEHCAERSSSLGPRHRAGHRPSGSRPSLVPGYWGSPRVWRETDGGHRHGAGDLRTDVGGIQDRTAGHPARPAPRHPHLRHRHGLRHRPARQHHPRRDPQHVAGVASGATRWPGCSDLPSELPRSAPPTTAAAAGRSPGGGRRGVPRSRRLVTHPEHRLQRDGSISEPTQTTHN